MSWQINFNNVPAIKTTDYATHSGLFYNIELDRFEIITVNMTDGPRCLEWAVGDPNGPGLQYWWQAFKYRLYPKRPVHLR